MTCIRRGWFQAQLCCLICTKQEMQSLQLRAWVGERHRGGWAAGKGRSLYRLQRVWEGVSGWSAGGGNSHAKGGNWECKARLCSQSCQDTTQTNELLKWTEMEVCIPNSADREGHTETVRN